MSNSWKHVLTRLGSRVEDEFDALKYALKKRTNRLGPVQILPYRGYGTADAVTLRGRVLEDKGLGRDTDRASLWDNLLDSYRRFESDEIPNAPVRVQFLGDTVDVVTDGEGYFTCTLHPRTAPPADRSWHEAHLTLLEPVVPEQPTVTAVGRILIPPEQSRFGIISDVDDTIMQTNATSLLQMARLTFLHDARTRMPFAGVSAFYHALRGGLDGGADNPLFFVSSSPWNLYDLLVDFLEVHELPEAPFLLRDLGLGPGKFIKSSHGEHKLGHLRAILETYPDLPFVLIGDSGQHDPEIYLDAVEAFPDRILAAYIRDVTPKDRDREVVALAEAAGAHGVPMRLCTDSAEAARHAAEIGLIPTAAIDAVEADRRRDEATPGDLAQLAGRGR